MFNVAENMLFSLNKSSTHRWPLQNAVRILVISYFWKICKKDLLVHILQTHNQSKKGHNLELSIFGSWFMVFLNLWLVVACGGSLFFQIRSIAEEGFEENESDRHVLDISGQTNK